jgi:hypothetical protein
MRMEQLTPESSGASPVALRIAKTVLRLNAFLPVLANLEGDYDEAAFAADVARIIDKELEGAKA